MRGDVKVFYRILKWRELNKPVAWIAREEEINPREVRTVLRLAGAGTPGKEVALDRYDRIEYLVNQGCSNWEIQREIGCDSRTIKKWFPRSGWPTGGGGSAALMRRANGIIERAEIK